MMRTAPGPTAVTHLVGHCIRQIESAMRALLVPIAKDVGVASNELLSHMREIFASAGIDDFSEVAQRLNSLAADDVLVFRDVVNGGCDDEIAETSGADA